MIDLDDFQEEHAEALSQAHEFARRARKKLPPDRWATDRQMHLVARGIEAQTAIIAMLTATLAAVVDDGGQ